MERQTNHLRDLPWWTPEDDAALELVAWAILELFESDASGDVKERMIGLAHDWVIKREAQSRYLYFRHAAREAWLSSDPEIHPEGVLGFGP